MRLRRNLGQGRHLRLSYNALASLLLQRAQGSIPPGGSWACSRLTQWLKPTLLGSAAVLVVATLSTAAADAAEALGITAHRLKALGLIDKIINEPVGGAHRDHKQACANLKRALNDAYRQVSDLKVKDLLQQRYDRLQSYGRFTDTKEH